MKYLFIITILVLAGSVGWMDYTDAHRQHEHYCSMVEEWHNSAGEYGWPPFKGECNND